MAFCVQCGTKLKENARFCGACGAKVLSAEPVMQCVDPISDMQPCIDNTIKNYPCTESGPATCVLSKDDLPPEMMDAYFPDAAKTAAKTEYTRPKRKFLRTLASLLVCLLLLSVITPTFLLFTVRSSLSENTFLSILKRIELDEIPASVLDYSLEDMTVAEFFCNEINNTMSSRLLMGTWKNLTPSALDKALDETSLLPFIAKHTHGITEALLDGETEYSISKKDIEVLLKDNLTFLEKDLKLPMEYTDLSVLSEFIVSTTGLDNITLISDPDADVQQGLQVIGLILSIYTSIAFCVIIALLILLLILTNRKDVLFALRDLGVVGVISGTFLTLAVAGSRIAISVFAAEDASAYIISVIAGTILGRSLIASACILLVGIVLLIINRTIRKIQKKKALTI